MLNIGRSLVYQSKLPKHAVFLMSRITSPLLKNESPYHILYDKIPDINDFKVFGCFVYETTIQSQRSKLDSRGSKVVFMGYKTSFKGSVLLDLYTKEIFISRHLSFHKHTIPYSTNSESPTSNWHVYPNHKPNQPQHQSSIKHVAATDVLPITNTPLHIPNIPSPSQPTNLHPPLILDNYIDTQTPITIIPPNCLEITSQTINVPKQATISKKPPSYLKDYLCSSFTNQPQQSSSGTEFPISHYLSYSSLFLIFHHLIMSINNIHEPKSYTKASKFEY